MLASCPRDGLARFTSAMTPMPGACSAASTSRGAGAKVGGGLHLGHADQGFPGCDVRADSLDDGVENRRRAHACRSSRSLSRLSGMTSLKGSRRNRVIRHRPSSVRVRRTRGRLLGRVAALVERVPHSDRSEVPPSAPSSDRAADRRAAGAAYLPAVPRAEVAERINSTAASSANTAATSAATAPRWRSLPTRNITGIPKARPPAPRHRAPPIG